MPSNAPAFPVIGIGVTAGETEALEPLFRNLPPESGCAFIIMVAGDAAQQQALAENLGFSTGLPVHMTPAERLAPNEIHLIGDDVLVDVDGGRLRLRKPNAERPNRRPLDLFLSALARDCGEYAGGLVLSGKEGDGALGLKTVKEAGGVTLSLRPDEVAADGAEVAITAGIIDLTLPVDAIGPRLRDFAASFDILDELARHDRQAQTDRATKTARQEICAILRDQLGHDFTGYKEKTFLRRVQRRMQVQEVDDLQTYVERMRMDPREVTELFRDLLINVTNFFRDPEAFRSLETMVIPRLLAGRGADENVRIWVPGCSTGEEVYSIAILMREQMAHLANPPRVQIFATDIDEPALSVARTARYPEALLDAVSPERRERFFIYQDGSYMVTKEVRDICVFSPHSVIRDPPFSRLDLVSCRNLLIYFGPDVQNQVIPTFHYALRPGGYLFLGTSENVSQFSDLFTPLDKKHRLFQSRESEGAGPRLPLVVSSLRPASFTLPERSGRALAGLALRQLVEDRIMERFAPAHVVVNRDGDVVHYSGRTGKYLEPTAGAPTRQLLAMARQGLRLDLRTALREAIESDTRITRTGAVESEDDRVQRVTLTVEPLHDSGGTDRLFLVVFSDTGPLLSREDATYGAMATDENVVQLERELRETREKLQSLIEEYETALEELKSSNEELVSVNEELQSTNEELEASKEELQSLNEELRTVNIELNGKVAALDQANSDLTNLFESTRAATIFLDRNMVIRSYTPAVSQIFNILPGDRGRPLTDLVSRVSLPRLAEDVEEVLDSGRTVERTLEQDGGGAHYLLRLLPYRNSDFRVEGVVLTFVDVTTLTQAEAHQRVLIAELNHRVKNMLAVVLSIADQTFRTTRDPHDFRERFIGRVQALALSYELLSREHWTEALVSELVRPQLLPFGLERVTIDGPDLRLKPKQALSLGMVIHELATNAGKYGALSSLDGRVEMQWRELVQGGQPHVGMIWREVGGPPVVPPTSNGFGLKLIDRQTAYELQGRSEIRFEPTGLVVSLSFPRDLPYD